MRLVSLAGPRVAAVSGAEVVDLDAASRALGGPALPGDMCAFLAMGEAGMLAALRALAFAARPGNAALRAPFDPAALLAPVPRPGKILGVGRNYGAHAKEVGGPAQELPRIFLKPATSVAPPGALLHIPPAVTKPDWEAELAVVIGRPAWQVLEADALRHVAGYTVLDDVSAREFQFDVQPPQTSFAKGMDGFCPMGPWIVTPDEAGEPFDMEVTCHLNGEEVQRGNTADLIFPVPALIAHLSRFMTLEPGDVIATGTPAGSGAFRTPPRWLRPGDRLRIEVARVGVLEHGIA